VPSLLARSAAVRECQQTVGCLIQRTRESRCAFWRGLEEVIGDSLEVRSSHLATRSTVLMADGHNSMGPNAAAPIMPDRPLGCRHVLPRDTHQTKVGGSRSNNRKERRGPSSSRPV
jgi:hypothetical protein